MVTAQELLTGQSIQPTGDEGQKIIEKQQYEQAFVESVLAGQPLTSYQILQQQGVFPQPQYQLPPAYQVPTPPWRGTEFEMPSTVALPTEFEAMKTPSVISGVSGFVTDVWSAPIPIGQPTGVIEQALPEEFRGPPPVLPQRTVEELFTGGYAATREYAPGYLEFGPFGVPGQAIPEDIKPVIGTKKAPIKTPALFVTGAVETLTPKTVGEAALTAALVRYWSRLPSVVQTGLGVGATAKGVVGFGKAKAPEEFGGATAEVGLGGLILAPKIKGTYDFFTSKPARTAPTPSVSPTKEFTRQRASAIIKDKQGNILLEKSADTGREILPGGDIKKTESPLQAVKREVKEELLGSKEAGKMSDAKFKEKTGIDLKNLKKVDEVQAIPEENQIVFELKTDRIDLTKLKAQPKEVEAFVLRKPVEIPKTPTDILAGKRAGVFGGKIRGQDAFSIARAEALGNVRATMKDLNPQQKAALNRLARDWANQRYGKETASRLRGDKLAEDYILFTRGLEVRTAYAYPAEAFMRRGQVQFLKTRVPAAAERTVWQKVTRKKPGTFVKFQKEPRIALGLKSRYDVPGDIALQYGKGEQILARGSPTMIKTEAGAEVRKGREFEVLEKFFKRGEKVFFFQPPTRPGREPFVAVDYLGVGGKESPEAGFTFFGKKPVIQYVKSAVGRGRDIIFTKKALAGTELEVGAPPGTVFRVIREPKSVRILGKKVRVQELEITKPAPGELTQVQIEAGFAKRAGSPKELAAYQRRVLKETGIEYETGYQPVAISKKIPYLKTKEEKPMRAPKEEALPPISKRSEGVPFAPKEPPRITPQDRPRKIPEEPGKYIPDEPPPTLPDEPRPTETEIPKPRPERPRPPEKLEKYVYKGEKPPTVPRGPPPPPPTKKYKSVLPERKPTRKKRELFVPYVRRFGKFRPVSRPVPFKKAKRIGIGRVRRTLGASLQVRRVVTGEAVKLKAPKGFRYGKREPLTIVQKRITPVGGRLATPSERREIVAARRVSWLRA